MIPRRLRLPQLVLTENYGFCRAWACRLLALVCAGGGMILLPFAGCVDFNLGQGQRGESQTRQSSPPGAFVVEGTTVLGDFVRPCLVFEAENGVEYHLVRGDGVSEALFEEVVAVGASSTLEVVLRRDLDERCQANDVLEVLEVINVLDLIVP